MFAAIVLAAGIAPPAEPAPLPDRWLLKLLPKDLPPLPDRFYGVTWFDAQTIPRFGIDWEFWANFRKADRGRPAEAAFTLTSPSKLIKLIDPPWPNPPYAPRLHRTARLAVHGPLVEFEGGLYTTTIHTWKDPLVPQTAREMLYLGSAIELKDWVWYQAGTIPPISGGPASVEEWRIEFQDDPRTADRGTAMLRGHWRLLTEPEGESFAAEVTFQAGKGHEGGRTVRLLWPTGMRQTRSLPGLEIAGERGGSHLSLLGVGLMETIPRMSLYPAPKPRPPVVPESSGLVQPPTKKPGK